MQAITMSLKTILNNKKFINSDGVDNYPPICVVNYLSDSDVWTVIPQIIHVNISREETALTQRCSFVVCNVNPDNIGDYGFFNPHRSDTTHSKPANDWYKILRGGRRIQVLMNYGVDNLVTVFTGVIDTVNMNINPTKATLEIDCRDFGRALCDQIVNSIITVSGKKFNEITYPLGADITAVWLDSGDTDPTLRDIVKDIIMRAGLDDELIVNNNVLYHDWLLSETNLEDDMPWENMTWAECIEKIKTVSGYHFWFDSNSIPHLDYTQKRALNYLNEGVELDDDVYSSLLNPQAYNLVVKSNNLVTTYVEGVDYIVDYSTAQLARILPGTSIPDNEVVKVSYDSVDWIFKNGINIMNLPLILSINEMYAGVKVMSGDGLECTLLFDNRKIDDDGNVTNTSYGFSGGSNVMWDGAVINEDKIKIICDSNLGSNEQCEALAARLMYDMIDRYSNPEFICMAIPHLEMFDLVKLIVYGTAGGALGDAYIIDGITLNYEAPVKMTMRLKTHYYRKISDQYIAE